MKMSGYLVALLAFAAASVAADFVITRYAIDANPSGNAGRLFHFINEQQEEIPIFGSSKVYYDYVPAELRINVYNYGLDGASYEVVDTLLQIELAKHKTSPIIIDLKPESEHGIGDTGAFIPFVSDGRIRELLERSHLMVWRYLIPGIRYFGFYDFYLKEFINDKAHLMRKVERGFSYETYWVFDRARLDEAVAKRRRGSNGYFPDEGQNTRLVARIGEHPERLFFLVYSPVHSSCLTNFQNSETFAAFKARLRSLPNVIVLDFEHADYPDEWFKDTNHLLYRGAAEFSRSLGAAIQAALHARATSISPASQ